MLEAKFNIKGGAVRKVEESWRAETGMKVSGGRVGRMCVFKNKGGGERGRT